MCKKGCDRREQAKGLVEKEMGRTQTDDLQETGQNLHAKERCLSTHSIAVKRPHDQGNSTDRLLMVSEI